MSEVKVVFVRIQQTPKSVSPDIPVGTTITVQAKVTAIETAEDGQRFVMTLDCGRPYKKAIGYKTTEPSDTSLSRAEEGKFILQLSKHPNLKTGDTVPIEIEPAT